MAEKVQCKSAGGMAFTMEVPGGWASKQVPGGCVVAKTDGTEFISVAYYPSNGLNAKAFAKQLAEQMKVQPKMIKEEDAYVSFDCTTNGQDVNITVTGKATDPDLQVTTQKGESETLGKIFDSLAF